MSQMVFVTSVIAVLHCGSPVFTTIFITPVSAYLIDLNQEDCYSYTKVISTSRSSYFEVVDRNILAASSSELIWFIFKLSKRKSIETFRYL
jgi:hypothetical protein